MDNVQVTASTKSRVVVVSGSEGDDFAEIRKITWPRLSSYAAVHGFSFSACDLTASVRRAPAWKKLVAISSALAAYDTAIWVDADVYVLNFVDNIMDGVPADCWQAMVRHQTNEGDVPNSGVWILRRPMLPFLMIAAMSDELVNHKWWEQAAIHSMMGFENHDGISALSGETLLYKRTHWLDESFNVCAYTAKGAKQNWLHACGFTAGRVEVIRGWDKAAAAARGAT